MRKAFSRQLRRHIWERDGGRCQICEAPVDFGRLMHVDHITPVVFGGCNHPENLRATHHRCNLTRNDYGPEVPHCPPFQPCHRPRLLAPRKVKRSVNFNEQELRFLDECSQRDGRSSGEIFREILRGWMDKELSEQAVAS